MGIFDFLKRKFSKGTSTTDRKADNKNYEGYDAVWNCNASIEEIWQITCDQNFVVAMYGYLCKKCDYGDAFEKLSKEQAVIYLCNTLEGEVYNGGYDQFFCNSSGNFAIDTVDALNEIGAHGTAKCLQKALSIFPNSLPPKDRDLRIDALNETPEDKRAILSELDDEFYEEKEPLAQLMFQYIHAHKDAFQ